MIATGLAGHVEEYSGRRDGKVLHPRFGGTQREPRRAAVGGGGYASYAEPVAPLAAAPPAALATGQLGDLDIPTFIRRQMD